MPSVQDNQSLLEWIDIVDPTAGDFLTEWLSKIDIGQSFLKFSILDIVLNGSFVDHSEESS